MSLPPYTEYRKTGDRWLPTIPKHWALAKCGHRYEVLLGKMLDAGRVTGKNSGRYLRNVDVQWDCINEADLPEMDFAPFEVARYSVRHGDLIVCEGGEPGRCAIWDRDYSCFYQKALHRLRPRNSASDLPRYMFYNLAVAVSQSRFEAGGDRATIAHLPAETFRQERFPFPSLDEQVQIARFLDYETARIDALIEKQQQLIALLKEKRQAVISHAVTKGLNPNAPLRDSGVEWLGMVPAHWKVSRIKRVAEMDSGHTPSRTVESFWVDCRIPWVSLNDTKQMKVTDYLLETAVCISEKGMANSSAHLLPAQSVVVTRDATIGLAAIIGTPMAVSQHIIAWICDHEKVFPEYLLLVFYAMEDELERYTFGATLKTIGMHDVSKLTGAFPPISEQREIVRHVFKEKDRFAKLTIRAGEMLELLQERRTTLISAAVTGKIDVRNWTPPESKPARDVA